MSGYVINVGGGEYKAQCGAGWITSFRDRARTYKTEEGAKIGLANLRKNYKPYPDAFVEPLLEQIMTSGIEYEFKLSDKAIISDCETYRYWLTRKIPSALRWIKPITFIMLNPSTADASENDPTIRRCIDYAKQWGFTDLIVVNIFAYRATDPKELKSLDYVSAVGSKNDRAIQSALELSGGLCICAWGNHGDYLDRGEHVVKMLVEQQYEINCLKVNSSGAPAHPLYQKKDIKYVPFTVELK